MAQVYYESALPDIAVELVKWLNECDERFEYGDYKKYENEFLNDSIHNKTLELAEEFGTDVDSLRNGGSLRVPDGMSVEDADDILQYVNENNLSKEDVMSGLKMRSHRKGGRPSKVEKWEERIVDGDATLEEAREHMSDPTWYKLRDKVDHYYSQMG